jgi:hypothetical protein
MKGVNTEYTHFLTLTETLLQKPPQALQLHKLTTFILLFTIILVYNVLWSEQKVLKISSLSEVSLIRVEMTSFSLVVSKYHCFYIRNQEHPY